MDLFVPVYLNFNPHHPCGWWHTTIILKTILIQFQSTPPVWVVTYRMAFDKNGFPNFNPHHPCGWWPSKVLSLKSLGQFQSTPPVWVVTVLWHWYIFARYYFNPHHPCGWWRNFQYWFTQRNAISIHTTRVGGDKLQKLNIHHIFDFNPHHPCGWWLVRVVLLSQH